MSLRFRDIPQFPQETSRVDVGWFTGLPRYLNETDPPLNLEPDYQRGHVWTDAQRIAFVEYGLMGGKNSMTIITNCHGWSRVGEVLGPYELVDGLQRVTAVTRFLDNHIPAFGHFFREYTDRLGMGGPHFEWKVMEMPTRERVLSLYLMINSSGVVHSPGEIARVQKLLQAEQRRTHAEDRR